MVRTIKAVTLIVLLFVLQLSAETPRSFFKKAAIAYRVADFEKAAQLYDSIKHKGPGVWFNLGNCRYALKQYPNAIVSWKRAQRGASLDMLHTIDHNLRAGYNKLGIPMEQSRIASLLDWGAHRLHPFMLQILFLIGWYFLWLLIIYKRKMRLVGFYFGLISFFLVLFGSVLLMQYTHYLYKKAVVVKKASLLAGPHEQYDVLKELPIMHDVQIRDEREGWYKVATQDQTGWISADVVETV